MKQIEKDLSHFSNCGFYVCWKKEEEAKEQNMERRSWIWEKKPTWQADFENGA